MLSAIDTVKQWLQNVDELRRTNVPRELQAQKNALISESENIKNQIRELPDGNEVLQQTEQLGFPWIPAAWWALRAGTALGATYLAIHAWNKKYMEIKERINNAVSEAVKWLPIVIGIGLIYFAGKQ